MTLLLLSRHGRTPINVINRLRFLSYQQKGLKRPIKYNPELEKYKKDPETILHDNLERYLVDELSTDPRDFYILTQLNEKTEEIKLKELSPHGQEQARLLGEFLKPVLSYETLFVTSMYPRSIDTMAIAQASAEVQVQPYRTSGLNERIPWNITNIDPNDINHPLYNDERFGTKEQIIYQTHEELLKALAKNPAEIIFAILHGTRNKTYINGKIKSTSRLESGNCSVRLLEFEQKQIKNKFYVPVEDMEGSTIENYLGNRMLRLK